MSFQETLNHLFAILALTVYIGGFASMGFAALAYLKTKAVKTETKLDDNILDFLERLAIVAVQASEQLGVSKQILNDAKTKREFAISSVQNNLDSLGVTGISVKLITDFIESAVLQGVQKGLDPAPWE